MKNKNTICCGKEAKHSKELGEGRNLSAVNPFSHPSSAHSNSSYQLLGGSMRNLFMASAVAALLLLSGGVVPTKAQSGRTSHNQTQCQFSESKIHTNSS